MRYLNARNVACRCKHQFALIYPLYQDLISLKLISPSEFRHVLKLSLSELLYIVYSSELVDKSGRSVTRGTAAEFIICKIDVAFKHSVLINNEQTVGLLVNTIAWDTLTRHMIL